MHPRIKIRQKIKELLTGLEITQDRVFTSLVSSLQDEQLPAIVIRTNNETVEEATIAGELRSLSLAIEICVKAADNFNDTADDIALNVEDKLKQNQQLNKYWQSLKLENTEIQNNSEGETPVTSAVLNYQLLYNK